MDSSTAYRGPVSLSVSVKEWQQILGILEAERARLLMVMFQATGEVADYAREERDNLENTLASLTKQVACHRVMEFIQDRDERTGP